MSNRTFESVKKNRNMPWLLLGMHIEVDGKKGTVSGGNASGNLDVIFEGQKHKSNVHPGWKTKFFVGDKLIAVDGKLVD